MTEFNIFFFYLLEFTIIEFIKCQSQFIYMMDDRFAGQTAFM